VGEKNNLLSTVASDNIIDYIKHLVKYLSYKVFSQAIYRYVISISCTTQTGHSPFQIYRLWGVQAHRIGSRRYPNVYKAF
jgi:hypothetical protein